MMIMHTPLLGYIHFGILLIFGVFVSSAFLGIEFNKKNTLILSGVCLIMIIAQIIFYYFFGYKKTTQIYPLLIHLPLAFFLTFHFHKHFASSLLAIMTAYLCLQLGKWIGLLSQELFHTLWITNLIRITFNISLGIYLVRYLASLFTSILAKLDKRTFIFSILPIVYYLFDYITTVYTDWLYSGDRLVFEFLPFTLAISYLIFYILYFKEYEQNNELERQKQIIEIQATQSTKEIDAIRASNYQTSIIRHDMRHHLQNIYSFVENNKQEEALEYIQETLSSVENASLKRFCSNELVNMILSYYKNIMDKHHIHLNATIKIKEELPCSSQEFSSILSNSLENAIKAVKELDECDRIITILLRNEGSKLLLSIQNPYKEEPIFVDDLPVSKKQGHGFGTQSILYVTQKLKGNCQFTADNGIFTLRVVI